MQLQVPASQVGMQQHGQNSAYFSLPCCEPEVELCDKFAVLKIIRKSELQVPQPSQGSTRGLAQPAQVWYRVEVHLHFA